MNNPINLLLVDDDPDSLFLIRESLKKVSESSYLFFQADCLLSGLEHLASTHIDLILLDLNLPDSTGLATVQKICGMGRDIPIVILTHLDDRDLAAQAIQMGAHDYVVKGYFDGHSLDRAIQNTLERHRLLANLQETSAQMRQIIENNKDGMIVVDRDGIIQFANPAALALFSGESHILVGKPFPYPAIKDNFAEIEIPDGRGGSIVAEMRMVEIIWNEETAELISLHDITERNRIQKLLSGLSFLDELTGLYNRRGFMTLSRNQLKLAQRDGSSLALFFADVDKLKQINDTYGHQVGDQALIAVAEVLKEAFRSTDIIAHLSGDEFAVLALQTHGDANTRLLKRIHAHIQAFNQKGTHPFALSLSIGAAFFGSGSTMTLEELLAEADARQYEEKKRKS